MPHRPLTPTLFPYTTLFRSAPSLLEPSEVDQSPRELLAFQHHADRPGGLTDGRRVVGHLNGRAQERRRRSEEHTSELQSLRHLVCRLLLEKKKRLTNASTAP